MAETQGLMVGVGKVDVSPQPGIQLGGDPWRRRPSGKIIDPLYAKAIAVSVKGRTLCFISIDALGMMRKPAMRIRNEAAAILGTEPAAIMPHASQCHSAPSVGNYHLSDDSAHVPAGWDWMKGGDPNYDEPLHQGVMEAVRQAKASLQPAVLKLGRAVDSRISFNRRFIFRDGRASWHPGVCYPNVLMPEGPSDPEVGVALFTTPESHALGAILHHTCHPCHGFGYPEGAVSADWPGLWSEAVSKQFMAGAVAMTSNGACGNIHSMNHIDPHSHKEDTVERQVGFLMEATERAWTTFKQVEVDRIGWLNKTFLLPWRELDPEVVERSRAYLKKNPMPTLDAEGKLPEVYARAVTMADRADVVEKTQGQYSYEMQLFRIGPLALVGWAGEPFVEAQLEVKLTSPTPWTFVAHFVNDQAVYLPTKLAFKGGGGEVDVARLAEGCLETVQDKTKLFLKELYAH